MASKKSVGAQKQIDAVDSIFTELLSDEEVHIVFVDVLCSLQRLGYELRGLPQQIAERVRDAK